MKKNELQVCEHNMCDRKLIFNVAAASSDVHSQWVKCSNLTPAQVSEDEGYLCQEPGNGPNCNSKSCNVGTLW